MKITVFGAGHVGLVTGACFADMGNEVVCVDIDTYKINMLNNGKLLLYEPELAALVRKNSKSGQLIFTTNASIGVTHGLFQFITVGTMPRKDGLIEIKHVQDVTDTIGQYMNSYKIIINKSTAPVGTVSFIKAQITELLSKRSRSIPFSVVSNPEFLREGTAVKDFMHPDRIIVGCEDQCAKLALRKLYAPFHRNRYKLIEMDIRSAEMTKYAANAMLATKISLMNEIANIAERLGADIEQVRIGIGADPRIGYHSIYPGCGYGGSCLPKDIQSLERVACSIGYDAHLLRAVELVNSSQKMVLFSKIKHYFGEQKLCGLTFGIWGLAFKAGTSDMREAPSRNLIEALWQAGCTIRAYDPAAMNEAKVIYGNYPNLYLCNQPMDVLIGADALVITTEWSVFRSPNLDLVRKLLKNPVIFDGRNLYDPEHLRRSGFIYNAIGRGTTVG